MKLANQICPTTTMGKVQEGAVIVDIRNRLEFDERNFDVPNYLNILLNELEDRIDKILKDKEIIMVCHSGQRRLKSAYFLVNTGYENVYNMVDGIIKWASKGVPTKGYVDKFLEASNCDCSKVNCC